MHARRDMIELQRTRGPHHAATQGSALRSCLGSRSIARF